MVAKMPTAKSASNLCTTQRRGFKAARAVGFVFVLLSVAACQTTSQSVSQAGQSTAVALDNTANLTCVFTDRASGKVVATKAFADINPEVNKDKKLLTPYKSPTRNVSVSNVGSLFKYNIKRYGIADIEKRTESLSWSDPLRYSYTPAEYNLHFMLSMCDRALGGDELGTWAMKNASKAQKQAALKLLHRVHAGYNGRQVTEDPEKMATATRYYTGMELLKPALYQGQAPQVGALAAKSK